MKLKQGEDAWWEKEEEEEERQNVIIIQNLQRIQALPVDIRSGSGLDGTSLVLIQLHLFQLGMISI